MKSLRSYETVSARREALEGETGVKLPYIGGDRMPDTPASERNCENMIGVIQIPVGVAGPLVYRSVMGRGNESVYLPLATTEGALVASVNRGCKAIAESGGAVVEVTDVGVTRAPVFRVESLLEGQKLEMYLHEHRSEICEAAAKTSSHLKLLDWKVSGTGKTRFVRFAFDTKDAMGLNMVTVASEALVRLIEEKTGIRCISLSGNYCSDKKPSWVNRILGRGRTVRAEVTVSASVVSSVLHVDPKAVQEVWLDKCMVGSAFAGSMGQNAQFANIVAALFIATGQDPAHVTEGSVGMTTTEIISGDLYVAIEMPDVLVGTVGGGTGLATQREALGLLGVAGSADGENGDRLAAIVGAAVLAGEISLLSSLAEGSLARSHERLARGKT